MTETTIVMTDASFGLLESLIAIAVDPAAASRRIAEVKAACEAARAEAETAEAKAKAAQAELDKDKAKFDQEWQALAQEREDLRLRRLAYRESERCLEAAEAAAARARAKQQYVGPAIDANPPGFAPRGSIAARARQDYAEAAPYVTSEFAREPPMLHREGLGGRRPQKRPEV
jgi:hypothetical protein